MENEYGDTGTLVGPKGDDIRYFRHQGGNKTVLFDTELTKYDPTMTVARVMIGLHADKTRFGLAANIHFSKSTCPAESLWFEGRLLAANVHAAWREVALAAKAMNFPNDRVALVGGRRKAPVLIWPGRAGKGMMDSVRKYLSEPNEPSPRSKVLLDYKLPEQAKKPRFGYNPRLLPPDMDEFDMAWVAFGTALEVTWYCTNNAGDLHVAAI
jgi:hypothetical protein